MNKNNDIFLKKMIGVNPIKKNNRVDKENLKILKNNNNKPVIKKKFLIPVVKSEVNFKKSEFKIENIKINKNIKKKAFKIDKKIDFHGKTLLDSERHFSEMVISCYNGGLRCLLFITGKGLFKLKKSDEFNEPKLYYGVIRAAFATWAKSNKLSKYILSYEPASIEYGGDGAFFVYLRKKKN